MISIKYFYIVLLWVLSIQKIKSIVKLVEKSDRLILSNNYVYIEFSILNGIWISDLRGDYQGKGAFSTNLLSSLGIRLERENADGSISNNLHITNQKAVYIVKTTTNSTCTIIQFPEVYDDIVMPMVIESWVFQLCNYDRSINFQTEGYVITDKDIKIRSIRHSLYALSLSSTAFYDKGVVQLMAGNADITHFGSSDRLSRAYFMGGVGAIDINRIRVKGGEFDQTVLLNADPNDAANSDLSFDSGFHEILIGNFSVRDRWCNGSNIRDIQSIRNIKTRFWTREWNIFPNNRNFPTSSLPSGDISNMDNGKDLEAYLTGLYGSAVPCLCTYPNEVTHGFHVAQIATTLRYNKGRGYDHTYNYFDPDNFMTLSAILYSGDEYLQEQARLIIEHTGQFMIEASGQLPHHFTGLRPTYAALSGEIQTGPNSFWIKTALRYAAVTGNINWLRSYLPKLRLAASYVFSLIDDNMNLLKAPGSLMIDVFIRNNYTSDSNAMIVGLLREFADAEDLVGDVKKALHLKQLADLVVIQMNKYLWASKDTGNDHYITQLNPDFTIKDFVDYDANLIAIANHVSDYERSQSIQKRISIGQCSASQGSGPQFVSEVYYGPEDTTNGNIGDSWCSMGRIAWYDAHGRKRFGTVEDLNYFNKMLLEPIQNDLIKYTWLHERYGCDGLQQTNRTMYYFEYPSLVTMLLREIRYGIELDLAKIHIAPFLAPISCKDFDKDCALQAMEYEFHMGNVDVAYSNSLIKISVPGSGMFNYKISNLIPYALYSIHATKKCNIISQFVDLYDIKTNSNGELEFIAPRGSKPLCVITVMLQSNKYYN